MPTRNLDPNSAPLRLVCSRYESFTDYELYNTENHRRIAVITSYTESGTTQGFWEDADGTQIPMDVLEADTARMMLRFYLRTVADIEYISNGFVADFTSHNPFFTELNNADQ